MLRCTSVTPHRSLSDTDTGVTLCRSYSGTGAVTFLQPRPYQRHTAQVPQPSRCHTARLCRCPGVTRGGPAAAGCWADPARRRGSDSPCPPKCPPSPAPAAPPAASRGRAAISAVPAGTALRGAPQGTRTAEGTRDAAYGTRTAEGTAPTRP